MAEGKINELFGARVRDGMRRASLQVKDVCDEIGISRETVRLWRKGHMARDEHLKRLAKMIDVDEAVLRYGKKAERASMSTLAGEQVTDDDELTLLRTYRQLKPWAQKALRARAVELLEEFSPPSPVNPNGKGVKRGTQ